MQAMKGWCKTHPHQFQKRPYDRRGCDNYKAIYNTDCFVSSGAIDASNQMSAIPGDLSARFGHYSRVDSRWSGFNHKALQ